MSSAQEYLHNCFDETIATYACIPPETENLLSTEAMGSSSAKLSKRVLNITPLQPHVSATLSCNCTHAHATQGLRWQPLAESWGLTLGLLCPEEASFLLSASLASILSEPQKLHH